jgi:predicted dehydrogenase
LNTPRVIRFGIIGGGLMGREFAACTLRWPALLDLDVRPEIVAICDTNPEVFAWYERNFASIRLVTHDYQRLLQDPEIDALYCAVPHHLHAQLYADVISAGKHLMGEKPFGIDLAANERIMAAVNAHPEVLVRVSSEFPFFPGAQRIVRAAQEDSLGRIIEVRSGFLHSSDLDPNKPINWKRMVEFNGRYGCMGDLGMHVVHLPFRLGWLPVNVRALLSNIVPERPGPDGVPVRSDTWDNAILAIEAASGGHHFPWIAEMKRIAPGETNSWYLEVYGTSKSMRFTTKWPRTLWTINFSPGEEQSWQSTDLGFEPLYRSITGPNFEFGFPDAILQMWAAFVDELANRDDMGRRFRCATPGEAHLSHRLFTAALESQCLGSVATV